MRDIHEARILVVEDDPTLREVVCDLVRREGYREVRGAGTVADARTCLATWRPDLLVLDVMLPDGNGFDLLRGVRQTSEVSAVFLSARDEDESRLRGLGLGADDYVTKPFNPLEVKGRIKAILRRTSRGKKAEAVNENIIEVGDLRMDLDNRRVTLSDKEINLTSKEFELLELLATHAGKVYSRTMLLQMVWGKEYPGDVRTVDVHIRRLREKIEHNASEPRYVQTKWGVGYYFRSQEK
jgi:DNA-binding response OmpR family regulator